MRIKNNLFQDLLKTSFFSILIRVINAPLLFGIGVLLARVLGPNEYGVYAFVMSIVMVSGIPVTAGMPNLFVREVSKANTNSNWSYVWRLYKWYLKIISIYSLLLFAVFVLTIQFGKEGLNGKFLSSLIYGFCLVPLLSMVLTAGASLRGLGKVVFGQIPNSIIVPAFFLLLIICMMLAGDLTAVSTIQMKLISTGFALIVGGVVLYNLLKGKVYKINEDIRIIQFRPLASLTLIGGFHILLENIDVLVLGTLCSREDVGVYKVSAKLSSLIVFGLYSINQILHPKFAKLYIRDEIDSLKDLVSSSSKIILMAAIPPVLLLIVLSGKVLSLLFGNSYTSGVMVLRILAIGQLINASFGSVGALLNMTGNENDTLKGMFVAVVMNLLLNVILVPIYGPEGAALSTAISCLTWNVILRSCVNIRLGIETCGWLTK